MKKLITLFLALTGAFYSNGQNCGTPLGSSGGQQICFQNCAVAYTVDFRNSTHCDLGIWWNYFTDCTDHLIPSSDLVSGLHTIPGNMLPGLWKTHDVYEIQSNLPTSGDNYPDCECNKNNCTPDPVTGISPCCTPPCYMVVEYFPYTGSFLLPTNLTFTAAASGGTYCGWLNCGGTIVCVTMMQLGPNYYSVDFHY
jgi:hypothetical protein